jgi:hypothetical protein
VVEERPELVSHYAKAMTRPLTSILADGVRWNEFSIDDVEAAAEVVRDAVTVFVHPAHVEASARAGLSGDMGLRRVMATLILAFKTGVSLRDA